MFCQMSALIVYSVQTYCLSVGKRRHTSYFAGFTLKKTVLLETCLLGFLRVRYKKKSDSTVVCLLNMTLHSAVDYLSILWILHKNRAHPSLRFCLR